MDTNAQSFVPEDIMVGTSSDIARVSIEFKLVKTPPQIQLGEHSASVKTLEHFIYSWYGQSLSDNGLVSPSHISTHSRMSPDAFGATTIGLTQAVGP